MTALRVLAEFVDQLGPELERGYMAPEQQRVFREARDLVAAWRARERRLAATLARVRANAQPEPSGNDHEDDGA